MKNYPIYLLISKRSNTQRNDPAGGAGVALHLLCPAPPCTGRCRDVPAVPGWSRGGSSLLAELRWLQSTPAPPTSSLLHGLRRTHLALTVLLQTANGSSFSSCVDRPQIKRQLRQLSEREMLVSPSEQAVGLVSCIPNSCRA